MTDSVQDPSTDPESPQEAGRPGTRGTLRTYERDGVTVSWDPSRCLHVAACIRAEPEVFDPRRRPWVDLAQGEPDGIRAAVRACPTGALRLVGETADTAQAAVDVDPDGPLYLSGDVVVRAGDGRELDRSDRLALCRCGATGNAPWCDGSHRAVGFSGGPVVTRQQDGALAGPGVQVTVTPGPYSVQGAAVRAGGEVLDAGGDCSLCRCGRSGSKPFCDGSHRSAPPAAV